MSTKTFPAPAGFTKGPRPDIPLTPVTSSQVKAIGYDPQTSKKMLEEGYTAERGNAQAMMIASIEDSKRAATVAASTSIGGNTISNVANSRTGPSVGQVTVHVDGGTEDMDRDDFAWGVERGLGRALDRLAAAG